MSISYCNIKLNMPWTCRKDLNYMGIYIDVFQETGEVEGVCFD